MTSPQDILTQNILPYWLALRDPVHGGFYSQVRSDETVVQDAPRGGILYARILWSFAAAYRVLHRPEYIAGANTAKAFIEAHMLDPDDGAAYWSVTADGQPLDTTRPAVVQAYMLYAYSEYVRATGDDDALQRALSFYRLLQYCPHDDEDTNLHVMEAYTNLYRVCPSAELQSALITVIDTFAHRPSPTRFNAGHCIECSWLLSEAAEIAGVNRDTLVRQLAQEAMQGFHADGTLDDREWWKQAEAVIGFTNIFRRFDDESARIIADRSWQLICSRYIDFPHGEWFWLLQSDGTPDPSKDKVSFWKCPYHNTRLCLYLSTKWHNQQHNG